MQLDWMIVLVVVLLLLALLSFVAINNHRDRHTLRKPFNRNYENSSDGSTDREPKVNGTMQPAKNKRR